MVSSISWSPASDATTKIADVHLQLSITAKVVEPKQSMTAFAILPAKSTARSPHVWTKYEKGTLGQLASC